MIIIRISQFISIATSSRWRPAHRHSNQCEATRRTHIYYTYCSCIAWCVVRMQTRGVCKQKTYINDNNNNNVCVYVYVDANHQHICSSHHINNNISFILLFFFILRRVNGNCGREKHWRWMQPLVHCWATERDMGKIFCGVGDCCCCASRR